MMMCPGRRTTRSISSSARATSGRCSSTSKATTASSERSRNGSCKRIAGNRAQRRRAAAPGGPDRRGESSIATARASVCLARKCVHRGRRARADLEHVTGSAASSTASMTPEQPAEVRRGVRRLLMRVSFVALVKRRHRGAYVRIRHLRRQLAVECVMARRISVFDDDIGLMRLLDVRIGQALTWRTSSARC